METTERMQKLQGMIDKDGGGDPFLLFAMGMEHKKLKQTPQAVEWFKKTLEKEIADWTERRKLADEEIRKNMGYQEAGPPNPYDSAALASLRAKRNADDYLKWKNEVLRTIKRSRGQRLPWRSGQ